MPSPIPNDVCPVAGSVLWNAEHHVVGVEDRDRERDVEEVAVRVLQDQREPRLTGVLRVRLGHGARRRRRPERPVVRLPVVVAGQPEAEQERQRRRARRAGTTASRRTTGPGGSPRGCTRRSRRASRTARGSGTAPRSTRSPTATGSSRRRRTWRGPARSTSGGSHQRSVRRVRCRMSGRPGAGGRYVPESCVVVTAPRSSSAMTFRVAGTAAVRGGEPQGTTARRRPVVGRTLRRVKPRCRPGHPVSRRDDGHVG